MPDRHFRSHPLQAAPAGAASDLRAWNEEFDLAHYRRLHLGGRQEQRHQVLDPEWMRPVCKISASDQDEREGFRYKRMSRTRQLMLSNPANPRTIFTRRSCPVSEMVYESARDHNASRHG